MQGLTPGNAPYITIKPNDVADLIKRVENDFDEGPFWLPPGTYALGADILAPTLSSGDQIKIKGAGKNLTIITGSGANILKPTNGVLVNAILDLEDLTLNHTCPASGIGIDTNGAQLRMKRALVNNAHATRTGKIGIKMWDKQNSQSQYLDHVDVKAYGGGFDLQSDHVTLLGCQASETYDFGFRYSNSAIDICTINPHVYTEDNVGGRLTDPYLFATNGVSGSGENITLYSPYWEPHAALGTTDAAHVYMFNHDDSGNYIVHVYSPMIWPLIGGAGAPDFANLHLTNRLTKVKIHDTIKRVLSTQDKRLENCGTDTIPNAATSLAVAHGLDRTPRAEDIIVVKTAASTNVSVLERIDGISATHFTVRVTADPGASGWPFSWRILDNLYCG